MVRNSFLDAAAELIAKKGFAGTSMREVAHAAGYTAPALYLYFKNKQALYRALLDSVNAELAELIAALPPANDLTFEQRVEQWARDVFEFVAAHAAVFRVVAAVAAGASSPPGQSGALRQSRLLAERDELVGAWLVQGKPLDRVGSFSATEVAALFRVLALHFWLQWSAEKQASPRTTGPFAERAEAAARLFLYGVIGQPAVSNEKRPAARRRAPR